MAVNLARGTRDHLPEQMLARQEVMDKVRAVFKRFGFEPLETPAFERIETLTGKYGDEGEKLMFRILKRGKGAETGQCDQALRYDLTVPLARVLAMNPALRMPFKRYQMQPVWRADRPQRGRFREFYQCDVDIAGSTSPLADAECLAVASTALTELGFDNYIIRLNDRRILAGMVRAIGAEDRETGVLVAVDKLDKIGRDGVQGELDKLNVSAEDSAKLWEILDVPRGHEDTLDQLAPHLDEAAQAGIDTLRQVLQYAQELGVPRDRVQVDPTLARGLDYYTGPVFEAEVTNPKIGSIAGGGRYDGLVGMFAKNPIPAVGISLGLERLITVMQELDMLSADRTTAQVFVTVYDESTQPASLRLATELRNRGIATDLYLGSSRLKAQFKYANARGYPFLVILGPSEIEADQVIFKNMATGEQTLLSLSALPESLPFLSARK